MKSTKAFQFKISADTQRIGLDFVVRIDSASSLRYLQSLPGFALRPETLFKKALEARAAGIIDFLLPSVAGTLPAQLIDRLIEQFPTRRIWSMILSGPAQYQILGRKALPTLNIMTSFFKADAALGLEVVDFFQVHQGTSRLLFGQLYEWGLGANNLEAVQCALSSGITPYIFGSALSRHLSPRLKAADFFQLALGEASSSRNHGLGIPPQQP